MDSRIQDAGFPLAVDGHQHLHPPNAAGNQDDDFNWLHCQHVDPNDLSLPPAGDPMEIDFDFDSFAWAEELDHPMAVGNGGLGIDMDLTLSQHDNSSMQSPLETGTAKGFPLDVLFAEDETAPTGFSGNQASNIPRIHMMEAPTEAADKPLASYIALDTGMGDMDPTQRLRSQLSLLSHGSFGDQLVFKNCDSPKAILLHGLTMELGLNYSHDATCGEVSITRVAAQQTGEKPEPLILSPSWAGLDIVGSGQTGQSNTIASSSLVVSSRVSVDNSSHSDKSHSDKSHRSSRSQRITESISRHVSTWKTSMSKGGRRGPLTEDGRRDMKVLTETGGACWRCKILRRKCDTGLPCRCCLQTVQLPTPNSGDDAPLWPLIGCRRGALRNALPVQVLCPGARRSAKAETVDTGDSLSMPRRSIDMSDRCLLSAESQRLADMKAVLERASYKLSISDPSMKQSFVSFIETGRYRNEACLQESHVLQGETVTYTEVIATVAWELAESQTALPLLEIKSWEAFMNMIETACIYEAEVGRTSLVMLSMATLRHCLEALRLLSAGHLSVSAHANCEPGDCQVQCIQDLHRYISVYVGELSSVIFNKENMRDRKWWLSTFYSLCIQSYVRHALIAIEKQLCFDSVDDVPSENLTSTQYLHLAAVLFTAASAKYDPLLGGRHQYSLTDNLVIPETTVPELHHSAARTACEVDMWPEVGIKTSYQFLRRLLQIGSLDFDPERRESQSLEAGPNSSMSPDLGSSVWSAQSTIASPTPGIDSVLGEGPLSPKTGKVKRWSAETKYSMWSGTSGSNRSWESLARTIQSDITSIYEMPTLVESVSEHLNRRSLIVGNEAGMEAPSTDKATGGDKAQNRLSSRFVCNCCPRTPQRFKNAEELRQHETEKPYPCSRCKKRFKSPTEADRHMNAVHTKTEYWSCKTLENPLAAFHMEKWEDVAWDVCGFCGGGFVRNGEGLEGEDRRVSELVAHLDEVHHHGECNREKRFYRVDNWRQHLKTTHEAKQGKWLKLLEGICRAMVTEETPDEP